MSVITPTGIQGTGSIVPGGTSTPAPPYTPPKPYVAPTQSQPVPSTITDFNKTNGPSTTSPTGKDVFGNPVTLPSTTTPPTSTTSSSGTSTGTPPQGMSQDDYNAFKQANPNIEPDATDVNNANNAQKLSDAQAQRDAADAAYQQQAQQVHDTITNIQNGTTPLTAGEQAQIDGLKAQFQVLIDAQKLQNTGASGTANIRGYQTGAAEYDPTFQVKTIGAVVAAGQQKIADLSTKMASAVASLTQSFHNNDIKAVTDAWNIYTQAADEHAKALQSTISDTQAAIKDAQAKAKDEQDRQIAAAKVQYDQVTKPMQDIAAEAEKNGASADVIANINAATSVADAATAAGGWLQTATGTLGDYLQYKRDAESKGLTPSDYQTYLDKQKAQDQQDKINLAYATKKAEAKATADYTSSPKVQQALEQQYRQVLSKEFSARTGALGIENGKVSQANHLNSLVEAYYDPKTGNYNIPTAQYAELAIGLANMVSGTGQSSDADRAEIKSKTAAGDLKGALQYVTGTPQNGNTQDIIKNLVDSIDRQAETATRNRQAALDDMKAQAPTDLDPARVDKLNQSTKMVGYEGQDRVSKTNVDAYVKANPGEAENIAKLYEVPGATNQDIEEYLKAQGKLQ